MRSVGSVILSGITGLRNRGVEALASTTIDELAGRIPSLRLHLLTDSPDYDARRLHGRPALALGDLTRRERRLAPSLARWVWPLLPGPRVGPFWKAFRTARAIIASGGDVFSSDYGGLARHLHPLRCALAERIPVIFLAQSIGPFHTREEADAWLAVARRARLITIRESLSWRYVTEDLGLSPDRVHLTADPAFLLPVPSPSRVAELLAECGLTGDRPIVALAPSQGIARYRGLDREAHLRAWRSVIDLAVGDLGAQVVLIPHVQERDSRNDDRVIAARLRDLAGPAAPVRIAAGDYSASELKGIIGAASFVVAERMHAGIAGLSSGVCTVIVGYSVKTRGIVADLWRGTGSPTDLQLPIEDFLRPEAALPLLDSVWARRTVVADQLHRLRGRLRQEAAAGFDLVAEALTPGGAAA